MITLPWRPIFLSRSETSVCPSVCLSTGENKYSLCYVCTTVSSFPLALWTILIVIRFTPSSLIVIKSLSKVFSYKKAQRLASTSRFVTGSKKTILILTTIFIFLITCCTFFPNDKNVYILN